MEGVVLVARNGGEKDRLVMEFSNEAWRGERVMTKSSKRVREMGFGAAFFDEKRRGDGGAGFGRSKQSEVEEKGSTS